MLLSQTVQKFPNILSNLFSIFSLPSTPSLTPISQTPLPSKFPTNLDARYREYSTSNMQLQLDWNIFVALSPLFGHHHESHRLHNWALSRLQYRQVIHKDNLDAKT